MVNCEVILSLRYKQISIIKITSLIYSNKTDRLSMFFCMSKALQNVTLNQPLEKPQTLYLKKTAL